MNGQPWTPEEDRFLRGCWRKPGIYARDIAQALARPVWSVHARIRRLGLHSPIDRKARARLAKRVDGLIRAKHPQGWTDSEIARLAKCDHRYVCDRRRALKLPHNAWSPRQRRRVARATRRQLKRMGLGALNELRLWAWRRHARASGWPEDLRKREVDILNLLWQRGPMTRREIAEAVGFNMARVAKYGQRCMLHDGGPSKAFPVSHGGYLANLMARGLIVRSGRCVKSGPQRGAHCYLYSLPLTIERRIAA